MHCRNIDGRLLMSVKLWMNSFLTDSITNMWSRSSSTMVLRKSDSTVGMGVVTMMSRQSWKDFPGWCFWSIFWCILLSGLSRAAGWSDSRFIYCQPLSNGPQARVCFVTVFSLAITPSFWQSKTWWLTVLLCVWERDSTKRLVFVSIFC